MSDFNQFFGANSNASTIPPGIVLSVTGNILGLTYEKTAANEVTVSMGACKDSSGSFDLLLPAPTTVTIPNTADTLFHLFLCDDGTVKTDTDSNGQNIPNKKRWIGFVLTKSNGEIHDFSLSMDGLQYHFNGGIEVAVGHHSGTIYTGASANGSVEPFVPLERVNEVLAICNKKSGGHTPGTYSASVAATGDKIYANSENGGHQFRLMIGTDLRFSFYASGGGAGFNFKGMLETVRLIR